MADNVSEKRRLFVIALARRILDLPEDAPSEELKSALSIFGVDPDRAIQRTNAFIKQYTQNLLKQTKLQHEAALQAFSDFQQHYGSYTIEELQQEISARTRGDMALGGYELQSYYRDLKARTGDDVRSELLDLLWEIHKLTTTKPK